MGALAAAAEPAQCSIGLVGDAGRIDAHQVPEDGALRRKICGVPQNVFERQPVVPPQFNSSDKRREFSLQHPLPKHLIGGSPIYHRDHFCAGQHVENGFDRSGKS